MLGCSAPEYDYRFPNEPTKKQSETLVRFNRTNDAAVNRFLAVMFSSFEFLSTDCSIPWWLSVKAPLTPARKISFTSKGACNQRRGTILPLNTAVKRRSNSLLCFSKTSLFMEIDLLLNESLVSPCAAVSHRLALKR